MPFTEKFATDTAVVQAGWTDPTYAQRFDNSYAYSETNLAEQTYSGYNISLTGTETVFKVFVRIKYLTRVTTVVQGDDTTATMSIKVYDGSTWTTKQVTKRVFSVSTINDESLVDTEGDNSNVDQFVDVTSLLSTKTKLSNAQVRLLFAVTADAGITVRWSVDGVSILACYHTKAGTMGHSMATTKYTNPKSQQALRTLKQSLSV